MGVDISACTGVAVTVDQLTSVVQEGNREAAARAILRYTSAILKTLVADNEVTELRNYEREDLRRRSCFLIEFFKPLSVESSVVEIRLMLRGMTEGVSDGFDSYVKNGEEAVEIWGALLGVLFPKAPVPIDTVFIGNPRYQGWELPSEEVLFVFSEDDCFDRVKTPSGKALDDMLGEELVLSRWTEYSV